MRARSIPALVTVRATGRPARRPCALYSVTGSNAQARTKLHGPVWLPHRRPDSTALVWLEHTSTFVRSSSSGSTHVGSLRCTQARTSSLTDSSASIIFCRSQRPISHRNSLAESVRPDGAVIICRLWLFLIALPWREAEFSSPTRPQPKLASCASRPGRRQLCGKQLPSIAASWQAAGSKA